MAGEQLDRSFLKTECCWQGLGLHGQSYRHRCWHGLSHGIAPPGQGVVLAGQRGASSRASALQWEPASPGCTGGGVYSSARQINGGGECKTRSSFARCAPLLLSWNINQKGLHVILEF